MLQTGLVLYEIFKKQVSDICIVLVNHLVFHAVSCFALRPSSGFRGINPRAPPGHCGLFHGPLDRLAFLRNKAVPITGEPEIAGGFPLSPLYCTQEGRSTTILAVRSSRGALPHTPASSERAGINRFPRKCGAQQLLFLRFPAVSTATTLYSAVGSTI